MTTEWASQFEGEHGATELIGLAVDAKGDVALAGHVLEDGASRVDGRKDAIVMKLASHDGSSLWRRKLGLSTSHDWSSAVAADSHGNFFVAGQTDGEMFSSTVVTGQDLWVAKLEGETGEVMWSYQAGSYGQEVASALATDPTAGDVIVCGSTSGGLFDREGSAKGDGLRSPSGEHEANGTAGGGEERGKAESFCAKLGATDGKVMWGSRLEGGSHDELMAVAVDPGSGDIFAAGFTSNGIETGEVGGNDFLAVRLDGSDGRQKWRATGGSGWLVPSNAGAYVQDSACSIAADGFGDVVVAGNTEGAMYANTADGLDTDPFVAKLNGRSGAVMWGWQGVSPGNGYANAVAVDTAGGVYACGSAAPGLFDGGGRGEEGECGEGGNGEAGRSCAEVDMFVAKLDGKSGDPVWYEQFGSNTDDHAVGLVLGPADAKHLSTAEAGRVVDQAEAGTGGGPGAEVNNPLYLTGWTRAALYSQVPAHWQDAWAVKLSNPPPETLGISGGVLIPGTGSMSSGRSGVTAAKQAASDAARGAVTIGFIGSVIGVTVILSAALCLLLRRASHGGALSTWRYDPFKSIWGRRRHRLSESDGGASGGGSGGGGRHHGSAQDRDNVELKLLSPDGGDGSCISPHHPAIRHGGGISCVGGGSVGADGGGGALGSGGLSGSSGRRETSKSPPAGLRPPTFYL